MADIIMSGLGGQGVLTAGKILINIAAAEGKNVSWTSTYGAAMRGGSASCNIVVSDEEIGSPYPSQYDILFAMSDEAYETYVGNMRDGGTVIINSSMVGEHDFPKNVNVYAVPATNEANEAGNSRAANLVMLGALIEATKLMDTQKFGAGLNAYFEKKGHNTPSNLVCYQKGVATVEKK
ncbi:2-oxoacid:acceptor oxidoreductase family protein [Megasphaera hominis]|jgi:2-oxoglutarate ferredoxin oxidoreductase subunit gamma|uniref:2-oxoacid:acceptor oxidoreductase family protein n=1 Tax=Megasphaera hominis TaxID=159836 RepID=A0ABR6VJ32_9FIRM|nr:2-oxoacid:acceptor oxidoreductase family protein [Megasphaera hominis]MBC3537163.1 2-oxoacid:acceptor oxidoreductase family protein [Megasphaera hominis]